MLAQEAVDEKEKEKECVAIPDLLDRLNLDCALVTIDAIACNPAVAAAITGRKSDYLLAVKANQPTLFTEIGRYFDDPRPVSPSTPPPIRGRAAASPPRNCASHPKAAHCEFPAA